MVGELLMSLNFNPDEVLEAYLEKYGKIFAWAGLVYLIGTPIFVILVVILVVMALWQNFIY